jgi:hypothetical protein
VTFATAASPGGALASGGGASDGNGRSVEIWAYFDGDTPVSGGRVRVYADGEQLPIRGYGPGPITTFRGGQAMVRFESLPSTLRVVVSGGTAGGEQVRGSLTTTVRKVSDGDLIHVNPVTTIADAVSDQDDGSNGGRARAVTERTLEIRPVISNFDLYATDQWFEGDRFRRWAMAQGSVDAGVSKLVRLIERDGRDTRPFLPAPGESSLGRRATSPKATAANVINGLIDGLTGAAGFTGPAGFAVSAVALFYKTLIGYALEDEGDKGAEDPVSAQLRGLSGQVSQLKDRLDSKILQLQIAPTEARVTDIRQTQEKFLAMLKWARARDDAKLSDSKRDEARASLINATLTFLRGAQGLVDGNVAAQLDKALRDRQEGGAVTNPVRGPALIPAVREEVAKGHFFTSDSSEKIRDFFRYYEWAQTELATVLTEYYMVGGDCALVKLTQGKENDCEPDRGSANDQVEQISADIGRQRATLPPKLEARVAIDRTNRRLWALDPTVRTNPQILSAGLVYQESGTLYGPSRYLLRDRASSLWELDRQLGWGGTCCERNWQFPTAADYQSLFAGPGPGNGPLERLNSLGVRYNGQPLKGNSLLWLAGDFYARINGGWIAGESRVESVLYRLPDGGKPAETQRYTLGKPCSDWGRPSVPYVTPTCSWKWNGLEGYVLWYRGGVPDAVGAKYWCNPARPPTWDPEKC